jgi:dGTPase
MVTAIVEESSEAREVVMPSDVSAAMAELRAFLFERVYLGPARLEAEKAGEILHALCAHYREHPDVIGADADDDPDLRITDWVSGMTDRFALRTYADAFLPKGIA